MLEASLKRADKTSRKHQKTDPENSVLHFESTINVMGKLASQSQPTRFDLLVMVWQGSTKIQLGNKRHHQWVEDEKYSAF